MIRLPPLGAIEAFVMVARVGSVKTAAETLALSPSALSRRIQTLENHLGETLFERRHQALMLTGEGERLLEAVAPVIDDLAQVFERITGPGDLRLRLGVAPLFASHVLMPHMPKLQMAHSRLLIELDTAPAALARLGESLDAAIWLSQDVDPRFYARKIGHNRIVAIASREWVESGSAPKTPAELRRHTVLVHRDMPHTVTYWFEGHNLPPAKPANIMQFDSGQLILDAAAGGMGVAFMLDTLIGDDPRLARLFDTAIDSPYEYWFVCRQTALSSKAVRTFHDWLFNEFPSETPAQG